MVGYYVVVRNTLGPEEARNALLEMIQREINDDVRISIDFLRTDVDLLEAATPEECEGTVRLGAWSCDLQGRRFSVSKQGPGFILHAKGVFVRGPNGKWIAKINTRGYADTK